MTSLLFHISIQPYTFYLLIFLRTDTKLIVNLELQEKFTQRKKTESFMITRAKISAVRALRVRCLLTFLSHMQRLFEKIRYAKTEDDDEDPDGLAVKTHADREEGLIPLANW